MLFDLSLAPYHLVFVCMCSKFNSLWVPTSCIENRDSNAFFFFFSTDGVSSFSHYSCLSIQEIPQSRRGGVILEHVLTVTPLNNDELPAPASCRPEDKVVVGGQNNTFLVQNLSPDGVYNVSLHARNSKGPSPATWKILRVRSSPCEYLAISLMFDPQKPIQVCVMGGALRIDN